MFKWIKEKIIVFAAKKAAKSLNLKEGPMNDKKKWYKSKGVWNGIIAILVGAYETARVTLAPQVGWDLPNIPPIAYTILGALGIYSRAVATSEITK